ncbi:MULTISPECIES: glycosyltransferase family 25 protein [unclassified Psychrobacter]|uniref:glycosyltransferase family 25 protein n=1 Tax=unclassified Psychrobacter TaxID=196806 RepID=UPI003FD2E322
MLKIYIVSLEKDIEKRRAISNALNKYDIKFGFVDAIYGTELSDSILDSYRVKSTGAIIERGFAATAGEIGCTLSHLLVYQDMLDNNIKWACILEDDVILDKRFKYFIATFSDIELDPNILYLLGGQTDFNKKMIVKSFKHITTIGDQRFYKTIKSNAFIHGSCCYLISLSLAKSIIELSKNKFIVADDWEFLSNSNIINKIFLSDFVDHPLDFASSSIQKERELASKKILDSTSENNIFGLRVKRYIKWRLWLTKWQLRTMTLKTYRYVEK